MSRLRPESKPFALQSVFAAAMQSGAPFGAVRHFSWPLTGRAAGMRATAWAASLAPSTVDFAAAPASWPKPSTFWRASLNVALTFADCCENQRPTAAKNPCSSRGFSPEGAASCANASAEVTTSATESTRASAGRPPKPIQRKFNAALVPMTRKKRGTIKPSGTRLPIVGGEIEEPWSPQNKYNAAKIPMTSTIAPSSTHSPRRFSMI